MTISQIAAVHQDEIKALLDREAELLVAGGKLENALLAILDHVMDYVEGAPADPVDTSWADQIGNGRAALRKWKAVSDE